MASLIQTANCRTCPEASPLRICKGRNMKKTVRKLEQHLQDAVSRLAAVQIIALVFLGIILLGAVLLSLPISSKSAEATPFLTALFTATSCTCVTGLSRLRGTPSGGFAATSLREGGTVHSHAARRRFFSCLAGLRNIHAELLIYLFAFNNLIYRRSNA